MADTAAIICVKLQIHAAAIKVQTELRKLYYMQIICKLFLILKEGRPGWSPHTLPPPKDLCDLPFSNRTAFLRPFFVQQLTCQITTAIVAAFTGH